MEEKNFPPPYLRRPYLPFLDDISPLSNHWPPLPSNFQSNPPLQQDLSLKPFYDDLTKGGLAYVYAKNNQLNPQHYYHKTTSHRKHVIIIGAGMAGLSAAFELAQAGHEVTILELQHRVGGRVKTIKDAFADGLHAEGGAMRLPYSHFLTRHYVELFKVKTRPFQDESNKGYLCFYGERVKITDWKLNPGWYCSKYWPGWDIGLTETMKAELAITGIDSYFTCTVKPVIEELIQDPSPKGWEQWVSKWSKMSVLEFLESDKHQDPLARHKLRPWPNKAIEAYRVRNYMPLMRASLVEYLRELIGKWWKDPMYTPVDGMENLAWAFTRENRYGWNSAVHLSRVIHYGVKVQAIEEVEQDHGKRVKVTGRNETSKQSVIYTGHAVIVTVPLTVLRQMRVQLSREKQQAIEGVYYEASTKILLQCRTRFWQKADNLQGGFSKTNLPIGQLHYPDWEESRKSSHERGILVIYTWAQEAEMFGAQTPAQAIENAVNQVATIHPEIRDNFEVGAVQAWFSDPSSQGAFVYLRPNQYNDSIHKLLKSEPPVFLAGEGLSWSNGWIQGAMESGLRAAYEFYCYNEQKYPPEKTTDETCQLHYPDWEESRKSSHERGILVIYTWAQEAEMFGAQTPAQAIENAVNQVATIHPEIRDNFEVGAVQAWFSDPSSQGAFVYLRPNQYNDSIHKLLKSEPPVFLAGEGLSWSNGWIQGAMESGLRAAYEFYCYNEQKYPPEKTTDETCQCMQGTMHAMHLQNGMWC